MTHRRLMELPRSAEVETITTADGTPLQIIRVTNPSLDRKAARVKWIDGSGNVTYNCQECGYYIAGWSGEGHRIWDYPGDVRRCEMCGHIAPSLAQFAHRVLAGFVVERTNTPIDEQLAYWRGYPVLQPRGVFTRFNAILENAANLGGQRIDWQIVREAQNIINAPAFVAVDDPAPVQNRGDFDDLDPIEDMLDEQDVLDEAGDEPF